LVASGAVDKDGVQVILFDQDEISRETKVRKSFFNGDGILQDWPFGFFEPSWS
jgi:predicted ATPase